MTHIDLPRELEDKIRKVLQANKADWISILKSAGEDPRTFFEDGDWTNADFSMSDMSNCSFRGAILDGAIFREGGVSLESLRSAASDNNISFKPSILGGRGSSINDLFEDRYSDPWNSLLRACRFGDEEAAIGLVDQVSDVERVDSYGRTALIYACSKGMSKLALKLLDRMMKVDHLYEDRSALLISIAYCENEVSNRIIDKMDRFDHKTNDGRTALFHACEYKKEEIALRLIGRTDAMTFNSDGKTTVLMLACKNGWLKTVKRLLEVISFLDDIDFNGNTALTQSCKAGESDIAIALIQAGADINLANNSGDTAIMISCAKGLPTVVEQLTQKVNDINARNNMNLTALHLACANGHERCVYNLIQDENILGDLSYNHQGIEQSALSLAVDAGHKSIVSLLKTRFQL